MHRGTPITSRFGTPGISLIRVPRRFPDCRLVKLRAFPFLPISRLLIRTRVWDNSSSDTLHLRKISIPCYTSLFRNRNVTVPPIFRHTAPRRGNPYLRRFLSTAVRAVHYLPLPDFGWPVSMLHSIPSARRAFPPAPTSPNLTAGSSSTSLRTCLPLVVHCSMSSTITIIQRGVHPSTHFRSPSLLSSLDASCYTWSLESVSLFSLFR